MKWDIHYLTGWMTCNNLYKNSPDSVSISFFPTFSSEISRKNELQLTSPRDHFTHGSNKKKKKKFHFPSSALQRIQLETIKKSQALHRSKQTGIKAGWWQKHTVL